MFQAGKKKVEHDPLKNPAPFVKKIYNQYQEQKQKQQQQQQQPQPEDQLKKSEQFEQQPKLPLQQPEISKSNFETPAAPITLSVEQILLLTAARQIKLQTSNISNSKHPKKKCPNWQVTNERKGVELSSYNYVLFIQLYLFSNLYL
ncbi:unnamed protein product [Ambrosiozyma monospora]|uniref:Unnamed protein product n=1 Tax=Ambrosiozyma monospora TaxID=43982 RepID=A0ACB5SRN6_AMBMO|nr:unnamed protein product [Ambrosiozyma monospora]